MAYTLYWNVTHYCWGCCYNFDVDISCYICWCCCTMDIYIWSTISCYTIIIQEWHIIKRVGIVTEPSLYLKCDIVEFPQVQLNYVLTGKSVVSYGYETCNISGSTGGSWNVGCIVINESICCYSIYYQIIVAWRIWGSSYVYSSAICLDLFPRSISIRIT